jgi:hypothetical protein
MKQVIFILGSGHCGSTLLDLMLDAHPSIIGVGEMHGLKGDSLCTCGKTASECSFWSNAAKSDMNAEQQIFLSKLDFLLNKPRYRSVKTKKLIDAKDLRQTIVSMYERMNAEIIVDSSKSVERALLMSDAREIEPIIIHLVRDGRAVTWSYIRKYQRIIPFFFKWALENLKIEIAKRRFPGQRLFVGYESLAAHPEQTLRLITDAIGIAYDESMMDFRSGEHHQMGGNRMRFETERRIVADESWRKNMPQGLQAAFNSVFGWLNTFYHHKHTV